MTNDISSYSLNAVVPARTVERVSEVEGAEKPVQSTRSGNPAGHSDKPGAPLTRDDLAASAEEMNALAQDLQRQVQFSVDDNSGEVIIKVVDRQTNEVVRQIPGEEILRLRQRLGEANGLIFQDSA